jgi:hypothetical protein
VVVGTVGLVSLNLILYHEKVNCYRVLI